MKDRALLLAPLVCLAAAGLAGCQHNIVRAAPPSVASAPIAEPQPQPETKTVAPPPEEDLPPLETPPLPAPEVSAAPTPPAPARPRPAAPVEVAKPKEPEAPQISPQLSSTQLADAQKRTTDDVTVAERNLQLANSKNLNDLQKDLREKVRGFLAQAHEAIMATDWLRAQNLAEKARVLSAELIKSF